MNQLIGGAIAGMTALGLTLGTAAPSLADENSNRHNVGGAILSEWIAVGRNGVAVTDELNADHGGKWQGFSNHNSIYYHRDTGAHQVGGLIRDRWQQMGWEKSNLGYPTIRELPTRRPGRFNRFQGGNIYWKNGTATAYNVQGEILKKWGALDYENDPLGFPTSNETTLTRCLERGLGPRQTRSAVLVASRERCRHEARRGTDGVWQPSPGEHVRVAVRPMPVLESVSRHSVLRPAEGAPPSAAAPVRGRCARAESLDTL